jgi:hypothetical protein
MALKKKPPSVYLDGRWSWSVPLASTYLPQAALDWWAWLYLKVFELTDWAQATVPPTAVHGADKKAALGKALHGQDVVVDSPLGPKPYVSGDWFCTQRMSRQ